MQAYPDCSSLEEFCEMLSQELSELLENYARLCSDERSLPIQSARQYVSNHYAEPLTLEIVANEVFLSPNYFSALFKKELKMTFNDYLTDVRIKAAKGFLSKPQHTIAQISEMVGYSDSKYFSRIFCKKVGLKPVEYRKLRAADMEGDIE